MHRRHQRLSRRHALIAILCICGMILSCAFLVYSLSAERADIFFASVAGFSSCAIIGWLEGKAAIESRNNAERWDSYDRRDLTKNDNSHI